MIRYKLNPSKQSDDPKVALEETKVAMAGADELMKAGVFKHHWAIAPGEGLIIAKVPSFEEAYKVGNRFWPGITTEIREIISWEKSKEIVLGQLKELAEQ